MDHIVPRKFCIREPIITRSNKKVQSLDEKEETPVVMVQAMQEPETVVIGDIEVKKAPTIEVVKEEEAPVVMVHSMQEPAKEAPNSELKEEPIAEVKEVQSAKVKEEATAEDVTEDVPRVKQEATAGPSTELKEDVPTEGVTEEPSKETDAMDQPTAEKEEAATAGLRAELKEDVPTEAVAEGVTEEPSKETDAMDQATAEKEEAATAGLRAELKEGLPTEVAAEATEEPSAETAAMEEETAERVATPSTTEPANLHTREDILAAAMLRSQRLTPTHMNKLLVKDLQYVADHFKVDREGKKNTLISNILAYFNTQKRV